MKRPVFSAHSFVISCTILVSGAVVLAPVLAQKSNLIVPATMATGASTSARSVSSEASPSGIYLVFPFENAGASSRLDWLSEGIEELTIQRLSAAGQQVYTHAGRTEELDRSGLPPSAKLSRASMLRIAQNMDADFVVFGRYLSDGQSLTIESQILRISPIRLLPAIHERGSLTSLMELHLKMLWRLLAANDHAYSRSFEEFSKAQRPLRLDAFEHYIRGLLANEDDARLRELRGARIEPQWPTRISRLAMPTTRAVTATRRCRGLPKFPNHTIAMLKPFLRLELAGC
jgi:TolB-like protein